MNHLYWVRHGENRANLTKEFSHRKVDYSLTPKGVLQAQQTARAFAGQPIYALYTSPLKRAVETAAILGEHLGLVPIVMEEFRELNVGDLEGQPVSAALWAQHDRIFHAWVGGDYTCAFPGGEDYPTLLRRMTTGLESIFAGLEGKNVIIVGHGGGFVLTLRELCPGIDFDALVKQENPNCAITEIEISAHHGKLRGCLARWASVSHLSGMAARLVPGIPQAGELK